MVQVANIFRGGICNERILQNLNIKVLSGVFALLRLEPIYTKANVTFNKNIWTELCGSKWYQ